MAETPAFGRDQIWISPVAARVSAAGWMIAVAPVMSVPLVSYAEVERGTRKVLPRTLRPLTMVDVSQTTRAPVPPAKKPTGAVPLTTAGGVTVHPPTSCPVVDSIWSPLPGKSIETEGGMTFEQLEKNARIAANAAVDALGP